MIKTNPFNPITKEASNPFNPIQSPVAGVVKPTLDKTAIKKEAASQKGVDPALYEQLRLRGKTSSEINDTLKPKSTVSFLPQAVKETVQGAVGYTPPLPNEPLNQLPLWKKTAKVAAEVPAATVQVGKDILKSAYGALTSALYPGQENVKIPFTNQTAQTFLGTYNEARKSGLSPLWASILTTSRAAGDVLIVEGMAKGLGKIPVERAKITTLTKQDLMDITRGEEYAGKVDPAKLDAFQKLSQEGINWNKALKDTGKIDVKTGKPRTLKDVIEEQANIIKQNEKGFAKIPGKEEDVVSQALAARQSRLKTEGFVDPVQNTLGNVAGGAGTGQVAARVVVPQATLYSGANGEVSTVDLDLTNKKIAVIQGDQRLFNKSKSYVESDQKLYDQYSPNYDIVKIEHPELPNKAPEYYDLTTRKWYSPDKAVAEVYAMQSRDAKYKPTETKPARLFSDTSADTLQKTILDAKAAYDVEQRSNLTPPEPTEFPQEVIAVRKEMANSSILANIQKYKDIPNIKVQFRDIYRNTLQVFGEDGVIADKILLEPLNQAKSDYIDFLNKEKADLEANIKFGAESKESKYIQLYGEGKVTKEELITKFGEETANDIIRADAFFREKYDTMLNRLNQVEQQIYPNSPYKWTPKRENYYRHFFEASNDFSRLQNILENPIKIDPLLVGISETTEPKSRWASFKQRRHTDLTKEDAVGGYIDYLKSVSYAINIDPQIGRIREFTDVLKRGTGINKNLNNYIQNLTNVANELSGKTHLLDRAVMEVVPGGRQGLATLGWLNRRVKANTILLSVRSSLAQILNLPQGLATAGPINSARGAAQALAQVFADGPMSKSTFIKERYFRGFNKFDRGIINNTKKFAVWMVGALDEVGTKIMWNGQYQKALSLGVKNPVKFADDSTRSLVAGRGIAEKPTIQNSNVYQLLAPFQYEMTNVWWVLEDMAKSNSKFAGKAGTFMLFFFYIYLLDNLFERITGGRPLLDPIEAIADGIKEIKADKSMAGWMKAGGRLTGEVITNLPGGQFIASSIYPEYGTTIAGVKIPTRKEFFGSADPTRFGEGLLSTKALSDPLFKIAPPFGGAQVKKTLQGIAAVSEGKSTTKSGNLQYKIDDSFSNYLQGILFGKYALPEAVEYYQKQGAPKPATGSGGNPFNPQ